MAEKTTIARPYAKAVFELAQAEKALPRWGDTLNALADLVRVPAVAALIAAPEVTAEKRAGILIEIAGDALDAQGRNLVRLLAEKHRLDCAPEIADEYERLRADAERVVDVEVRAPIEVDAALQQRFVAGLKHKLGRDVRLHCVVDDSLVGGAVIRAGDIVIDDSIRGKLAKLAAAMSL
ncbi:MAG TPA: F0F1 ATP synthase subunit delta [Gammaproteobacteria bacterium]|nr:F0F1 ATP synthase subunit delta [Gammaproteobacteria bacterium]